MSGLVVSKQGIYQVTPLSSTVTYRYEVGVWTDGWVGTGPVASPSDDWTGTGQTLRERNP